MRFLISDKLEFVLRALNFDTNNYYGKSLPIDSVLFGLRAYELMYKDGNYLVDNDSGRKRKIKDSDYLIIFRDDNDKVNCKISTECCQPIPDNYIFQDTLGNTFLGAKQIKEAKQWRTNLKRKRTRELNKKS